MAVLDPHLRVPGLENIRICDSSVMPGLVGSNTSALTIMISEKTADMIRGNRLAQALFSFPYWEAFRLRKVMLDRSKSAVYKITR